MSSRIKIPKAVREQVWIQTFGKLFNHKCYINWCENEINVYDFSIGHNIPVSNGGTNELDNLKPICARCNLSMSNTYTIDQWNTLDREIIKNIEQESIKKPTRTTTQRRSRKSCMKCCLIM